MGTIAELSGAMDRRVSQIQMVKSAGMDEVKSRGRPC